MADREHKFDGPMGACSGCEKYVEELIDERFCSGEKAPAAPEAKAARASFEEDHSPAKRHQGRGHRSIPHSYGGEGRNFVD